MIPMCFSLNDVNSEILRISVQLDVQTIEDRLKIELKEYGGSRWTRTIDLTLIRRAL
jgi:hypothetical protein